MLTTAFTILGDGGVAAYVLCGIAAAATLGAVVGFVLLHRNWKEGPSRRFCTVTTAAAAALVAACLATAWVGVTSARSAGEPWLAAPDDPWGAPDGIAAAYSAIYRETGTVFSAAGSLALVGTLGGLLAGLAWYRRLRRDGKPPEGALIAGLGCGVILLQLGFALFLWSLRTWGSTTGLVGYSREHLSYALPAQIAWSLDSTDVAGWLAVGVPVVLAAAVIACWRAARRGFSVGGGTVASAAAVLLVGGAAFAATRSHADDARNPPPFDCGPRIAENESMRLPRSLASDDAETADDIEIRRDAVYYNHVRVATIAGLAGSEPYPEQEQGGQMMVVAAPGSRDLPREATLDAGENGGPAVSPHLSRLAVAVQRRRRELLARIERWGEASGIAVGRGDPDVLSVLADGGMPAWIVKRALFAAWKVGVERFALVAKKLTPPSGVARASYSSRIEVAYRAAWGDAAPPDPPPAQGGGVVAIVGARSVTVVSPGGSGAEPSRIEIAHVQFDAAAIAAGRSSGCPGSGTEGREECLYWTCVEALAGAGAGIGQGAAVVPDLRRLHEALEGIAGRSDGPGGARTITFRVEDDVPWAHLVALIDFARFSDLVSEPLFPLVVIE